MEIWRLGKTPPPPKAPAYFQDPAKRYWDDIVASRRFDYFDAPNRPLLEALCITYAILDDLWREIHKCDPGDPKDFRRYARLLMMANRHSKSALMLATKLRLLPARTEPMPQMARNSNPLWGT
jgi:hypothetical protein